MSVDWSKLKENEQGKGFEELAIDYLKDTFKTNSWIQTQLTRDGNKDAYSIIFFDEESWAEAKFTKSRRLSRYRLDATIVSAIIHENKVVEVIFITNSEINEGTKIDIEKALNNAIGEKFRAVYFKTKLDLEFWLFCNPEKYVHYFPEGNTNFFNSKRFDNIIITSHITFFHKIRHTVHFREPLKELICGEEYEITFSLFSPIEYSDSPITLNSGLISLKTQPLILHTGQNHLHITCKANSPGQLPKDLLSIHNKKIQTYEYISILEKSIYLTIRSQKEIAKNILESFKLFREDKEITTIHTITGKGATGKSVLLHDILKTKEFQHVDIIYQCFTKDSIDNSILIINIILSILFYHSDPNLIDLDYLHKLKEKIFISNYITELVKSKINIEKKKSSESIEDFIVQLKEYQQKELFPGFVKLNRKAIILDDIHKLDEVSMRFLLNLLADLKTSGLKCFIILCGRSSFWELEDSKKFLEENSVKKHTYGYTLEDLIYNMGVYEINLNKNIINHCFDKISPDIFFTFSLFGYLKDKIKVFNSISTEAQFALLNLFLKEDYHAYSILRKIENLADYEKDILKIVYFSLSGIEKKAFRNKYMPHVEKLKNQQLIIYNNDRKYIPYHDFYYDLFKQRFYPPSLTTIKKYTSYCPCEYDLHRDCLLLCSDDADYEDVLQHIEVLIRNHKYYTSLYILEPLFVGLTIEDESIKQARIEQIGEKIFYHLKFYYAYSNTNCGKIFGGKEEFLKLYNEIKEKISPELKLIQAKTIAELINSSFEHLALEDISTYAEEMNHIITVLSKEGLLKEGIESNGSYLLTEEIHMLTQLMLDNTESAFQKYENLVTLCNRTGNRDKINILKIRYARSIYHQDISRAYHMIDDAVMDFLNIKTTELKWILLGEFEKCFIDVITESIKDVKALRKAHDDLKEHFFNDHKKGNLVMAGCYIFLGMKEQAYDYLHKDYFIKREMRPRFKALRLNLLAIYESVFNHNNKLAKEYNKEQQTIFASLGESYKCIINHNCSVLSSSVHENTKVKFYITSYLEAQTLYIDPRLW